MIAAMPAGGGGDSTARYLKERKARFADIIMQGNIKLD